MPLTTAEKAIANNVLAETEEPQIAILIISLRRLFSRIAMERHDLVPTVIDVYEEVKKLDRLNQLGFGESHPSDKDK